MGLKKLIKERFSVRKYKSKTIEKAILTEVLDAGRVAPSAANYQPWHFIAVQHPENLKKLHLTYKREWIRSAPAIIIVCGDHRQSWKRGSDNKDFSDVDIAIAVDHMTLRAVELGLGTCWVCNFDAKRCSELFELPAHIEPLVLLPIGYPDEEVKEKKRKSLDEIVHWESFNKPVNCKE